MTNEELDAACKAEGLTDGQRAAREFVVAARVLEAAKTRWHDAFMALRLPFRDDEACLLVAEAIRDLGVEPVGDYPVVMARHAPLLPVS